MKTGTKVRIIKNPKNDYVRLLLSQFDASCEYVISKTTESGFFLSTIENFSFCYPNYMEDISYLKGREGDFEFRKDEIETAELIESVFKVNDKVEIAETIECTNAIEFLESIRGKVLTVHQISVKEYGEDMPCYYCTIDGKMVYSPFKKEKPFPFVEMDLRKLK